VFRAQAQAKRRRSIAHWTENYTIDISRSSFDEFYCSHATFVSHYQREPCCRSTVTPGWIHETQRERPPSHPPPKTRRREPPYFSPRRQHIAAGRASDGAPQGWKLVRPADVGRATGDRKRLRCSHAGRTIIVVIASTDPLA
jgi:hypothetical protein